ncbi:MAG: hypothetical protein GPJ14_19380 [Microcystis aeruginosa G11-01]|nr:hypothetical protein [Microcystis aeruginosa G11-01]
MKSENNKRFAFSSFDSLYSSIWRLWSQGNDIYVASRAIAGDIKTSLHESGMCQTSFTSQFMDSNHPVRAQVSGSRHIIRWKRQPIQEGLFRLFDIVIPHQRMKYVELEPNFVSKIDWFPICIPFLNTQISFFLSQVDFGENKWIGKNSMKTKLLHKGKIYDEKILYVVYYGHNKLLKLVNAQVVEQSFQENTEYRMILMGIDQTSNVGYLIDSSADKVIE